MTKQFISHQPVLDKGFIGLVDVMGNDQAIVDAARVSYGEGTKKTSNTEGLIRRLMRHKHTSPFEMAEMKFCIKMPLFVARQHFRHRTASINEYSGRYSEMLDEFYVPNTNRIRGQSESNHQATDFTKVLTSQDVIQKRMIWNQTRARGEYETYLDQGVARELARINLPLSQYTMFYWKINLHNLMNFIRLRYHEDAQHEIAEYARVLFEIVTTHFPITSNAFRDYILDAKTLHKYHLYVLKWLMKNLDFVGKLDSSLVKDILVLNSVTPPSKSERQEIASCINEIYFEETE